MTNSIPSHDAAAEADFVGTVEAVLRKHLQSVDDMLPARVISYDRASNWATVAPLIAILLTDGSNKSRPSYASIQVMQFGGGGVMLNFPLKPGDLGWIKANDRDISLFSQSLSEAQPNTNRLHSFSDAVFIPDVMRNYVISGEDSANAVLQTLDGSVRLSIWPNKIKMSAPLVEIEGPLYVTGKITSDTEVEANGIKLTTHLHEGVVPGSGTSGGPLP